MLDIQDGDFLVMDGVEYPIKQAAAWRYYVSARVAMKRVCRHSASTKRAPAMVNGKRGDAYEYLDGLHVSPLDPVSPEVRERLGLDTPNTLFQTFVADSGYFHQLIVEDLKR